MQALIQQLDAELPQTQCGQCGYGGCLPYATAIAKENELINKCPPGGKKALLALAKIMQQDPAPYLAEIIEETPHVALIKVDECIGCMKCIKACPVDAIIGAPKQLHVVLTNECTGCELCVEPCPVDCIEIISLEELTYSPNQARKRHYAKNERLSIKDNIDLEVQSNESLTKKAYIQEALARARAKKQS